MQEKVMNFNGRFQRVMIHLLRIDFSGILLVDPSNSAAQEEMKKLTILIQQDKAKVCSNDLSDYPQGLLPHVFL